MESNARKPKLQQDAFPAKLVAAIDAGGKHTRSEWAKYFKKTTLQISLAMNRLRKHGRMIFPIGGKDVFPQQEGILTDISLLPADIRETMLRTKKQYLSPQLSSTFRIQEDAIINHPEMYEEMESHLVDTLTKLLEAKEQFKVYGHQKYFARKN